MSDFILLWMIREFKWKVNAKTKANSKFLLYSFKHVTDISSFENPQYLINSLNTWQVIVHLTTHKTVARIIKTQRQILGFNLKVRKVKQPTTRENFYLYQIIRPKGWDLDSINPYTPHNTVLQSLPLKFLSQVLQCVSLSPSIAWWRLISSRMRICFSLGSPSYLASLGSRIIGSVSFIYG